MRSARMEAGAGNPNGRRMGLGLAIIVGATVWALPGRAFAGDAVPPQLVGEWVKGTNSTIDFVDPKTGAHGAPSGSHHELTFYSDGHYVDAELEQVTSYSCQTGYFGYIDGVVLVSGPRMSLRASNGTLRQWSTCSHRDDTKRINAQAHNRDLTWEIKPNPQKPGERLLVLKTLDGKGTTILRYVGPPSKRTK